VLDDLGELVGKMAGEVLVIRTATMRARARARSNLTTLTRHKNWPRRMQVRCTSTGTSEGRSSSLSKCRPWHPSVESLQLSGALAGMTASGPCRLVLLFASVLPSKVHARGIDFDTACARCLRSHALQRMRLDWAHELD
jgi:hypothetical protein